MSLAFSIYVLFVSLIQQINGAEFLNITSLLLLRQSFATTATGIVPLTSIYASL